MNLAYLGLGSNIGDQAANIHTAVEQLRSAPSVARLRLSPLFYSDPVGENLTGRFVNAAAEIKTELGPTKLLDLIENIELTMGRTEGKGLKRDRIIDIDILTFNDEKYSDERLTIPHPLMAKRAFVLAPFAELAPDLIPAGFQKKISELLAAIGGVPDDLQKLG